MARRRRITRYKEQDADEDEDEDEDGENDDIVPAKSTGEANEDGEEEENNKDYHRNVRH